MKAALWRELEPFQQRTMEIGLLRHQVRGAAQHPPTAWLCNNWHGATW
jgi:hypothetical protein